jgi:hypothetical protein
VLAVPQYLDPTGAKFTANSHYKVTLRNGFASGSCACKFDGINGDEHPDAWAAMILVRLGSSLLC